MQAIGIDLGTTSICGAVIDCESGAVLNSKTVDSNAFMSGEAFERLQSPEKIISLAQSIVDELICDNTAVIGVTGQMHGILYYDAKGNSVSPLYTWQDGRGDLPYKNTTYAGFLGSHTGYGNVTDFYNRENGLVPDSAVGYCTVHDWLVMKLCGLKKAQTHISDAASLGCFDLESKAFTYDCGIDVINGYKVAGTYKNIPVSVAIGDNQASVFSSLPGDDCILLNVGTGSQISVISDGIVTVENIETRPYFEDKYLVVGAALCGGRAYALLKDFYKNLLSCKTAVSDAEVYSIMNKMLERAEKGTLSVDTRFSGTRADSAVRGSITGISTENFTPQNLTYGVLEGMINELYGMYCDMKVSRKGIVGSGNGIRKNKDLIKIAEEKFRAELKIPRHTEEAAFGAAMFGLVSAGVFKNADDVRKLIKFYEAVMDYTKRLKHHYQPKKGWINDPNGLVYFRGYYHVFYQCSPNFETPWHEPMHWGHARTKDFVTFEELPVALSPDKPYDAGGCWSGTAIVKDDILYLFYASIENLSATDENHPKDHIESVSVAYSKDGINFEKYEGNPIIPDYPADGSNDFRDPAIMEKDGKFYLIMATGQPENRLGRLLAYESENLFDWNYIGIMKEWQNKRFAECPSFMKCGDKYMLTASVCNADDSDPDDFHHFAIMYGDFDGKTFDCQVSGEVDMGPDQYAGQAFRDHLGRNILIAWIPGWEYKYDPCIGCMSLPRELTVKDGKVCGYPVKEVQHLLTDSDPALIRTEKGFIINREGRSPVIFEGEITDLKILRDEYIIEVFINGGEKIYTALL